MTIFDERTHVAAMCGVLAFGAIGAGERSSLIRKERRNGAKELKHHSCGCKGLCVVTTMMTLEAAVPRSDRAVVTASRNFARLLGASVGVAAAGSTVSNRLSSQLDQMGLEKKIQEGILNDPASIQHKLKDALTAEAIGHIIKAYVNTFKLLFWMVTGLLLFAFFTAVLLIRHHSLERDDDEEQKVAAIVWLEEEKAKKEGDLDVAHGDAVANKV